MNDNKSRRVGNIFPVLQDACRFYREKELMDTYGKELEYFCTRILLCSSMGRISRVRDRKLRKSLREETFVFLREISGVSEEPLSGQWTERALSADRHTGIVRDLWGNHRQMQAGRVTGIENGGQRKGEKYADIGSNGHL